ncbi:MAG: glycosyltransferase [Ferruginibacter sp.]|nr:glycosyltransferase [Ferruginibacter sp.]
MKVLWLASIYPSKLFPYDGDFIQRHAQAVSLFCNIEVLHVVKDEKGVVTQDVKEIVTTTNQLTERIIYYKPGTISIRFVDRFLSSLKYKQLSRNAVKKYLSGNDKPAFLHLHIAMKAGLTAIWAKKKYKIPYLLTEHWGGYLDEAVPSINDYNSIYHYYWNRIITGAKASTYVSAYLQKLIEKKYKIQNTVVIPNVVNTDIFYPAQKSPAEKIRFIHVSTMVYQKNPEAILQALALLKTEFDFEAYFYGPVTDAQIKLIEQLGLKQQVLLKGEVPQEELAKTMQQCDALILYSRFETFGCVLIEANACGVPVIVSDLKIFHEIVEEGVNGLFAEGEKPGALAEKIKEFVAVKNSFDKQTIAATAAEKYNYKKVGQQFFDLYNKLLAQ